MRTHFIDYILRYVGRFGAIGETEMKALREQTWTLDHLFGRIFTRIDSYLIEDLQRPL
jgi:hypothetical protein